ncbi:MAG: sugar transferase [Gemmatimonadetes bacterium]|nr:sugar transferase [Gemmatimonadota bacterium]
MPRSNRMIPRLAAASGDAIIILTSPFLAYWLRFRIPWLPGTPRQLALEVYLIFAVLAAATGVVVLYRRGCYRTDRLGLSVDVTMNVVRAVVIGFFIGLVAAYFSRGVVHSVWLTDVAPRYRSGSPSRIVLLLGVSVTFLSLIVWRRCLGWVLARLRARVTGALRVALYGVDLVGQRFWEISRGGDDQDYVAVGYIAPEVGPSSLEGRGIPLLGSAADIRQIIEQHDVEQIVATTAALTSECAPQLVDACRLAHVSVAILADGSPLLGPRTQIHREAGVSVLDLGGQDLPSESRLIKRTFDLVGVIVGFAVLSWLFVPLFTLVSLLIKLESRGPVLFRQTRPGRSGRMFTMYKFRSMRAGAVSAEAEQERLKDPRFKLKSDPRVTRVGRFLRRFSIDELPQLWNVLMGDMSLVGPRPPTAPEVDQYENWQMQRFDVRPGLVGLGQVSGRSDLTAQDIARLDLYYIENWSVWLDVTILLKSVSVILRGEGAY